MLIYPSHVPGVVKISYDEPSSTLFIWYSNKKDKDAYKIDRNFFNKKILPNIDGKCDFRALLIWGERNNLVQKIKNAYLKVDLYRYEGE